ncbi:monovalent cation/H+ antiporter complex subunit F [Spiribacter halobius]|uniref:pH regulation protein F n=1 Tax=Sediminicurvatus halobius TaxID=2182432 RepID=A0A2U2N7R3_9GAMM|nr:monovalent cation/H+ antiporter complex subunit F [Spiribacter halobius]PWG65128.1 pH regulation protein F [Spiribacter halobius]UEX78923.1 monovalent cation/H+ antiporter complex subunit F [Spiribacter halobius]
MSVVLLLATLAIFATMALALVRALRGPTVYDRIVAVNVFGTKTVLLVALIVYITGHADLIDVALVYALINFIAIVTVLKLVRQRDLAAAQPPRDRSHG